MKEKIYTFVVVAVLGGLSAWAVLRQREPVETVYPTSAPVPTVFGPAMTGVNLPLRYKPAGVLGDAGTFGEGPIEIAVDGEGRLLAACGNGLLAWDHCATPLGRIGEVTELATRMARDGLVVQSDDEKAQVVIRGRDGIVVRSFGPKGPDSQFRLPNGSFDAAVDDQGRIWVTHSGAHRVEAYTPEGRRVSAWGFYDEDAPAGFGGCCNPVNIAVGPDGLVAVAVKAPAMVKVFTQDGELRGIIGPEHFDPRNTTLDLAVDVGGRIYTVDRYACVVKLFAPIVVE